MKNTKKTNEEKFDTLTNKIHDFHYTVETTATSHEELVTAFEKHLNEMDGAKVFAVETGAYWSHEDNHYYGEVITECGLSVSILKKIEDVESAKTSGVDYEDECHTAGFILGSLINEYLGGGWYFETEIMS